MLAVRLPKDIEDRLNAVSASTGKPKSLLARQAITEMIEDWEDLAIAEQRMAEIRAGAIKPVPLEEVMKKLGMDD